MVDISYEVDGRKVTEEEFADDLQAAMFEQAAEHVADVLRDCKCPTHGEHPSVTIQAAGDESFELKITGCCEELEKIAMEAFGE